MLKSGWAMHLFLLGLLTNVADKHYKDINLW